MKLRNTWSTYIHSVLTMESLKKTIKVVEFALSLECQKQLFYQRFDSTNNILIELIEFCKRTYTTEKIFQYKGDGTHPNKKTNWSGERHQPAMPETKTIVSNQSVKYLEEALNK